MGASIPKQEISSEEKFKVLESDLTVESIAKYIRDGRAQRIVVMAGE